MKKLFKPLLMLMLCFLVILGASPVGLAHSGRTDSSGGHKDNKNASGLGYYHYHCGGNPPHLHPNGTCPYKTQTKSTTSQTSNSTTKKSTYKFKPDIKLIVAGNTLNVNIIEIDGRTLVPLRPILEALGASVSWNSSTKTITTTKTDIVVILVIDSKIAKVNNVTKSLDVAPIIVEGSTMIPVRFIAESFEYIVNFNNNIISISK